MLDWFEMQGVNYLDQKGLIYLLDTAHAMGFQAGFGCATVLELHGGEVMSLQLHG